MSKGTAISRPGKPHPDFPLFPHATGRWAKTVRGRFCFFGKAADDPKGENVVGAERRPVGRPYSRVKAEGFSGDSEAIREKDRCVGDIRGNGWGL